MADVTQLFHAMERLARDLSCAGEIERLRSATWQPFVDIYELDDRIIIVVELPGVRKEDIDLHVANGVLRIEGVRSKQLPERVRSIHQIEIPHGRFARFLRLPGKTPVNRIDAKLDSGYLTITIPRGSSGG
jgi:HSP20 family protein